MKIEHFPVAILTIDLIAIEGVIVISTIGIPDKQDITVIIIQEIKQLAIKITGYTKPIL